MLLKDKPDIDQARIFLEKSIKLHEEHMNGNAPTTGPEGEKSQQKLMDYLMKALSALGGNQNSDNQSKGLIN